jgi:CubicO group peptidase (beta-lactamase class C family)
MRLLWALLFLNAALFAGDPARVMRIDQLLHECTLPGPPGASVLVVDRGETVVRKSYGPANLEERVPATPDTNYRLASVTKQFTAMAIMLLAERGKLSYDQKIEDFFPALPAWSRVVTLRQLLNHTSGIMDYEDAAPAPPPDPIAPRDQLKEPDVLRIMQKLERTYFEPGTEWRYSNSGYVLLGIVVEKVSGMTFPRFLKQNIFDPLGMTHTVAYQEGISVVRKRAYGYSKEGARFVRHDQSQTSALLGDGGVYSSIDDLAKWDRGLADMRLVKPETWKQAVTSGVLKSGKKTNYGFAWRLEPYRGHTLWSHDGDTVGFRTTILRFPDDRLTVVLLLNREDLDSRKLASAIADLYLGGGR